MADDETPENPLLNDEEFRRGMEALLSDLVSHMEEGGDDTPIRTFPGDTKINDLPDDLTPAEAQLVSGSKFDPSIVKLRDLMHQMGFEQTHWDHLVTQVQRYTEPVFSIADDTIDSMRPKGLVIDLVTLGMLAHTFLQRIEVGGVIKSSDLLNGKGPFGDE